VARKRQAAERVLTTEERIADLERYLAALRENLDKQIADVIAGLRLVADAVEREDTWMKSPDYKPFDPHMSVEGVRVESLMSTVIHGSSDLRIYRLPVSLDRIRGVQAKLAELRGQVEQSS
jgi:hypothetical protein